VSHSQKTFKPPPGVTSLPQDDKPLCITRGCGRGKRIVLLDDELLRDSGVLAPVAGPAVKSALKLEKFMFSNCSAQ